MIMNIYPNRSLFDKNKLIVLKNNSYMCCNCGNKATEVHHKDGSKTNHSINNLIPVCDECHKQLHVADRKSRDKNKLNINAINELLIKSGLNKSEFANKLGMLPSSLSIMFKRGSTLARTIKKMSEILNCDINDILSEDYKPKPSNDGYQITLCLDLTEEQHDKLSILSKHIPTNINNYLKIVLKQYINGLKER